MTADDAMEKWRCIYRISLGDSFGTFAVVVEIDKSCDFWSVAQGMYPHAHLMDMEQQP